MKKSQITKNTSLGAIKEDRVMVFSGKGPGLVLEIATMTKQSPEGTAFTLPLYHPVAPLAVDAILQRSATMTKRQQTQPKRLSAAFKAINRENQKFQ